MRSCDHGGIYFDPMDTTFFASRETIVAHRQPRHADLARQAVRAMHAMRPRRPASSASRATGWSNWVRRSRSDRRCRLTLGDNPDMTDNRIIGSGAAGEDDAVDASIRPRRLAEYLGQAAGARAARHLHRSGQGTRRRADHVLIFGPPGAGQDHAQPRHRQRAGRGLRVTSGPVIEAGDLAALLTNLQPHDVLFVDEIHRLSPVVEEVLYPAMEDFQIDIMIGEGPAARSIKLDLPPFTLIGATTRAGLLTAPLRDRFGIVQRLEFYSALELTRIVRRSAASSASTCTDGAAEIARRARGTPRIANRAAPRARLRAGARERPHRRGSGAGAMDAQGRRKASTSSTGLLHTMVDTSTAARSASNRWPPRCPKSAARWKTWSSRT
jgi:Holliday junction DNA helicase RuvB subunit